MLGCASESCQGSEKENVIFLFNSGNSVPRIKKKKGYMYIFFFIPSGGLFHVVKTSNACSTDK